MGRDKKVKWGALVWLFVLGVCLAGLKLVHVVHWSWWLVLAPIYGPYVLVVVWFVITMLLLAITG